MNPFFERGLIAASLTAALLAGIVRALDPFWNWDMLPYMAAASELDGATPEQAHVLAYSAARSHVPSDRHHWLVDPANSYRSTLAQDPTAFADQLPFYWIKPLYIVLVWAAWKAGASLAWSTVLPSIVGYMVLCVAVFAWARCRVRTALGYSAVAVLFWLPQVNEIAGLSTPDAVSAALIISGSFLLYCGRHPIPGLVLLVVSIAARMDNAILVVLVIATQRWCHPDRQLTWPWVVSGGIAAVVMYAAVHALGCAHGWCVGPEHAFLPRSLHPQEHPTPLNLTVWVSALNNGFHLLRFTAAREFAGLLLAATALAWRLSTHLGRPLLVLTISVCFRYLLFPVPDDRALVAWYALVVLYALEVFNALSRRRTITAR